MTDIPEDKRAALDALRDSLHDETDEKEEIADEAGAVVDRVRSQIFDLVEEYGDTVTALEAIAVLAEDELDGITTRAVRRGYAAGKRRPV